LITLNDELLETLRAQLGAEAVATGAAIGARQGQLAG
jgi:hypothetical protein